MKQKETKFVYEPHYKKPIPRRHFIRRVLKHALAALALIVVSLFGGMAGYHIFEDLSWLDAFLNAAMLLGGMGPVEMPQTNGGKIFAGLYALYAGLVVLISAGVILAPALHRMMHLFHWKDESNK